MTMDGPNNNMHDFHEADRIAKIILEKIRENKLKKLTAINLELGSIIEHDEEIKAENLKFNLKLILKDFIDENTKINIKKVYGESWKLISIEGD